METPADIFFSVVIPTYNRAHFICKTIDSVLQQAYNKFEVIVIDDGSTDNTEDVLRKYAGINFTYIKKPNEERAAARNYGAKIAKGNYINWFDSDDIMFPNHLSEAVKTISQYHNPELFALPYQLQTTTGSILNKAHYPIPTINHQLFNGNILACNPVFVRRDIALQFPFNENRNLSGSEDYELWLRLSIRYPIYCGNTITSALIEHDTRSMNLADGNNTLQRYELVMESLNTDKVFKKDFSDRLNQIKASYCMLVALYFSLDGKKKATLLYLSKSLRNNYALLFSKRMLVVLKYLALRW